MELQMPSLRYAADALEPVISEQTMSFHYGKHFQNYVNTLKLLIENTDCANESVETIVKETQDVTILNNAGQVLNHALYFEQYCKPRANNVPKGKLAEAINANFGSFDEFKDQMSQAAATLFGSGWAWLAQDKDGKLLITREANGNNPLTKGLTPIYGIDVWEHAYYIDFQNRRADYILATWDIVDWDVVERRLL